VRLVAAERSAAELADLEPMRSFGEAPDAATAARHYLERALAQAGMVSFDGTGGPEVAVRAVQPSRLTDTEVVRFAQSHRQVPVFGSQLVVEVDRAGKLVGVDAEVAEVDASPVPTLDAAAACARVAALGGAAELAVPPPTLTFFRDDDDDRWHLAWWVREVPFAPPGTRCAPRAGRGHGRSPRDRAARFDWLVDAHDGAVLLHYGRAPQARADEPLPVQCTGVDEAGATHTFYGVAVDGGFELYDPTRRLRTYDFAGGDISVEPLKLPRRAVRHAAARFAAEHAAAVAAHVNVARVLDFYRSVLMRDSVDDRGMEIVSVVDCISSADEDPPDWQNAVWWNGRMWYGRRRDGGRVRSFSAYLDVIAHELTHGVIDCTSELVYQGQSGALNESLSDILGMIVFNWYTVGADSDPATWTWAFGPGLGEDGAPIRDLARPRRTGDPEHMDEYVKTREDHGGVHSNSNIHNKAAYHLLTARAGDGPALGSREAAVLYYLCLVRLPQRASFARTLRGLLDVATTYFAGDPELRARKLAAIEAAYAKVGIFREVEG
jgi:Zn-dependent metalloprotease